MLKIRGRVLPSTLESISLWAERMAGGAVVNGETAHRGRAAGPAAGSGWSPSRRPTSRPCGPSRRPTSCCSAPGSLFTSVLPHLAVPEIARGA